MKQYPVGEALRVARSSIRSTSTDANGWVPYAYFGDPVRKIQLSNPKQIDEEKTATSSVGKSIEETRDSIMRTIEKTRS